MDLFNQQEKENILVSACLLGYKCRWHGKVSKSGYIKKNCIEINYNMIPVCPEMLGGLPCPRMPVKRKKGEVYETCADKEQRPFHTGKCLTKEFNEGALKTLQIAKDNKCTKAILCSFSPSCDKSGITGKLLQQFGIEIINTF
jgi:uncharacterized protein YbbK (DUF523 family)